MPSRHQPRSHAHSEGPPGEDGDGDGTAGGDAVAAEVAGVAGRWRWGGVDAARVEVGEAGEAGERAVARALAEDARVSSDDATRSDELSGDPSSASMAELSEGPALAASSEAQWLRRRA